MKREYVAIRTSQMEVLKICYETFFSVKSNELYTNQKKVFKAIFYPLIPVKE
jgi:hypothetical protein